MSLCLTDTHAHLADSQLLADVEAIVARALAVGVERILTVGIDLPTSRACVELADRFDPIYAAVGIHPQNAIAVDSAQLDQIRSLAGHPKVVAIGETGLDYVREGTGPEFQRSAFKAQLSLAADLHLPVVVHNRGADADILSIIGEAAGTDDLDERRGVLHCFTGDVDLASRGRSLGYFVSFAGNLTYRRSTDLREVAAALPLDWVLTETDSPYLTPEPHRGKTNGPANVEYVVKTLADVRTASVADVASKVRDNASQLFGWPLS